MPPLTAERGVSDVVDPRDSATAGASPEPALRVPTRLLVAIPTFRRPQRLAALLSRIPEQAREVGDDVITEVLVVDNDPDEAARSVAKDRGGPEVRYVAEPQPGIAAARNRALIEAEDFDLLAFIDDDEVPLPGWLSSLVATWQKTGASAVAGRVITVFPEDVDPWVLAGGYFQRSSRVTGTRLEVAATGNLLLDLNVVRALGTRFDERLGLAGGEDNRFTRELVRSGGSIVWCQESVAEDHIEANRLTRSALLRRALAHGNVSVRVEIGLADSRVRRAQVRAGALFGGAARFVLGALRLIWGRIVRDLRHDARGRRTLCRGVGMVRAAVGSHDEEYRR